jgi:RNA polymerase sigma-70 factor (ECF subfamily)
LIDFDTLYAQHSRDVFRFALSLSGNQAMAEDITSETFVRVWSARDRLDLSTVIGYLMTIARHLYLEQLRRERGRGELAHDPPDHTPGPHALAEGRSELDAVLADLQALPELDRAALLMRAQEKLSYEEIAAALGIAAGAAKTKVHRARRKIAELRVLREESREKRNT